MLPGVLCDDCVLALPPRAPRRAACSRAAGMRAARRRPGTCAHPVAAGELSSGRRTRPPAAHRRDEARAHCRDTPEAWAADQGAPGARGRVQSAVNTQLGAAQAWTKLADQSNVLRSQQDEGPEILSKRMCCAELGARRLAGAGTACGLFRSAVAKSDTARVTPPQPSTVAHLGGLTTRLTSTPFTPSPLVLATVPYTGPTPSAADDRPRAPSEGAARQCIRI